MEKKKKREKTSAKLSSPCLDSQSDNRKTTIGKHLSLTTQQLNIH